MGIIVQRDEIEHNQPEETKQIYGGGFYDKFLAQEPEHPTVALCYDFQVLPHLDTQEFDIPVDLVLWA